MDIKIQELTDKIYSEGVQKGTAEAERIIAEAKAKAQEIEREAKAKAQEITLQAERNATDLRQSIESELKLHASKLVEALRASLSNTILGKVTQENVQALSVNPQFIQGVVTELVKHFDLSRGVEISTADAESLTNYFTANAKDLLNQGVKISRIAGKSTNFVVAPLDGAYKIQIGEEEFLELFKSFLRPQMNELLF